MTSNISDPQPSERGPSDSSPNEEKNQRLELEKKADALRRKGGYYSAALIYDELGDSQSAAKCREKLKKENQNFIEKENKMMAEREKNVRQAAASEKKRKITTITAVSTIIILTAAFILCIPLFQNITRTRIDNAIAAKDFDEAEDLINGIFLSEDEEPAYLSKLTYARGIEALEAKNYDKAEGYLSQLPGYSDADERIRECRYLQALHLFEAGDPYAALCKFDLVHGYNDTETILTDAVIPAVRKAFTTVGNNISFEKSYNLYEWELYQPLDWRVLAYQPETDRILLLCNWALRSDSQNMLSSASCWAKSPMRLWLNSTFLNDAFTEKEMAAIASVNLGEPGADTDRAFLLNREEVERWLPTAKDRSCQEQKTWCTRTFGNMAGSIYTVDRSGDIALLQYQTTSWSLEFERVRPAVWVDVGVLLNNR